MNGLHGTGLQYVDLIMGWYELDETSREKGGYETPLAVDVLEIDGRRGWQTGISMSGSSKSTSLSCTERADARYENDPPTSYSGGFDSFICVFDTTTPLKFQKMA